MNQSQLSRCSSQPPPQTAQNVGELNRGLSVPMVFERSEIGVPFTRSVKRDPVSIVAEIFSRVLTFEEEVVAQDARVVRRVQVLVRRVVVEARAGP